MIMPPHPGMIDMDNLIILLKVIAVQVLLLVVLLLIQQNIVLVVVLHGSVGGTIPGERRERTWSAHPCPFFLHCTVYYVYTPYVCMQNIYIYYTCACVCTLAYVNVYMHTVI